MKHQNTTTTIATDEVKEIYQLVCSVMNTLQGRRDCPALADRLEKVAERLERLLLATFDHHADA